MDHQDLHHLHNLKKVNTLEWFHNLQMLNLEFLYHLHRYLSVILILVLQSMRGHIQGELHHLLY